MDTTSRLELRVGLLVAAGLAAIVSMIIISDMVTFESNYTVRVYMNNAGGLNKGSPVTLSGIRIGSVEDIRTTNDMRGNIEALISVSSAYDINSTSGLERSSSGIFGDSFLAFAAPADVMAPSLPKDGSAVVVAQSTVIDRVTGQVDQVVSGLTELLGKESVGDMRRLVRSGIVLAEQGAGLMGDLRRQNERIGELVTRVETLVDNTDATRAAIDADTATTLAEMRETLVSLRSASDQLSETTGKVGNTVDRLSGGGVKLIDESGALVAEARTDLREAIADMRGVLHHLRTISADIENGRGVIGQLLRNDALAKDLNDTVITAEQVADRVADSPEILIWGTNNEERAEAAEERKRRQARRAFMEGFEIESEPVVLESAANEAADQE